MYTNGARQIYWSTLKGLITFKNKMNFKTNSKISTPIQTDNPKSLATNLDWYRGAQLFCYYWY